MTPWVASRKAIEKIPAESGPCMIGVTVTSQVLPPSGEWKTRAAAPPVANQMFTPGAEAPVDFLLLTARLNVVPFPVVFVWFMVGSSFPVVFVWFVVGSSFPVVFVWFVVGSSFPVVFVWFVVGSSFPVMFVWFVVGSSFPVVFRWFAAGSSLPFVLGSFQAGSSVSRPFASGPFAFRPSLLAAGRTAMQELLAANAPSSF
jgi:hypothetical protein